MSNETNWNPSFTTRCNQCCDTGLMLANNRNPVDGVFAFRCNCSFGVSDHWKAKRVYPSWGMKYSKEYIPESIDLKPTYAMVLADMRGKKLTKQEWAVRAERWGKEFFQQAADDLKEELKTKTTAEAPA